MYGAADGAVRSDVSDEGQIGSVVVVEGSCLARAALKLC